MEYTINDEQALQVIQHQDDDGMPLAIFSDTDLELIHNSIGGR